MAANRDRRRYRPDRRHSGPVVLLCIGGCGPVGLATGSRPGPRRLARRDLRHRPARPACRGAEAQGRMSHRPLVLVCDHEPLSALALRRVLRDADFDVDVTSTDADALDRATLRVPDAVIVELGLPDGDGADVSRRARVE
jgi:PleD family two-component response regulator